MALVKRGKTWHTHFFMDGQRFRQSLGTTDWREAQAREKELIALASQGKLAPASQQFSKLKMDEAITRYLADREVHVERCSALRISSRETSAGLLRSLTSGSNRCWHDTGIRETAKGWGHIKYNYQYGVGDSTSHSQTGKTVASPPRRYPKACRTARHWKGTAA